MIDVVGVTLDGRHVSAGGPDGVLQRWHSTTGMPITDAVLTERFADVVSDRESVENALAILDDVRTIAAVLASLTTIPPLSVALPGDWGAGKSSFMRQLQVRVAALAGHSARTGPRAAFAANVRQVGFNAWHYSDDHLWVGLVEHLARHTPLLSTPRAIKKLTNLYRLLRLSEPTPNLDAFLGDDDGGPYQAATLLLAGSPPEARALLTSLTAVEDTEQGIVDTLRATENGLATRLADLVLAIRKDIPVHDDTAAYRRWATVVARYGFQTHDPFTGADRPMGW